MWYFFSYRTVWGAYHINYSNVTLINDQVGVRLDAVPLHEDEKKEDGNLSCRSYSTILS